MNRLNDGRHYRNFGRIDPSRNVFRIALCDRFGSPLVYYRAYWSPKRGTYRCYPESVVVPGEYDFDAFVLGMHDARIKK